MLIDGAGDQFLAGAALAGDQHGHVLRGDPADRLVHFLHLRAAADEHVRGASAGGSAPGDDGRHVHQPARLARLGDQVAQLRQFQRLEQVFVRPALDRLDGQVGGAVAGDQDDRNASVVPADLLKRLQSGGVAEVDVEDDDVRRLLSRAPPSPRRPTTR